MTFQWKAFDVRGATTCPEPMTNATAYWIYYSNFVSWLKQAQQYKWEVESNGLVGYTIGTGFLQ